MTQTLNRFYGYTPNKFKKFSRGRIIMVLVGEGPSLYVKVTKKEFYKMFSSSEYKWKINGFTFEENTTHLWVDNLN